ncbi:MAG: response regulator [Alphaproteobacteria bacterium]|nr:response regulator [Alphaproteobacteria bacterium]
MATVLAIDDDTFFRAAFRAVLKRTHHVLIEAETGVEGEHLVFLTQPDIVFTDIFMPVQNGLEPIINIRKMDKTVQIVAVSGGGMSDAHSSPHFSAVRSPQNNGSYHG